MAASEPSCGEHDRVQSAGHLAQFGVGFEHNHVREQSGVLGLERMAVLARLLDHWCERLGTTGVRDRDVMHRMEKQASQYAAHPAGTDQLRYACHVPSLGQHPAGDGFAAHQDRLPRDVPGNPPDRTARRPGFGWPWSVMQDGAVLRRGRAWLW
jgi:hypothetical protein